MKKVLTLIFFGFGLVASAQDIPNASFENWHPYGAGEFPDFWTSSDSVAQALGGGASVYSGTDFHDGSKSMHLKNIVTTFPIAINGPGIATNGNIKLNGLAFEITGGSPDTARSRYLTGWYKYTSQHLPGNTPDEGIITIALLRDSSGTRDTIATGGMLLSAASNFTFFAVEVHFQDWVNRPDTCLIIIQSSISINGPNFAAGSELVIDSLNFDGFVGVEDVNPLITSANIYPSPANDHLFIDVVTKNNIAMIYEIYDMSGRLAQTAKINSVHQSVDVSKLAEGNYMLKISDTKKNVLYYKSIAVAR